jgi:hypothetical protein
MFENIDLILQTTFNTDASRMAPIFKVGYARPANFPNFLEMDAHIDSRQSAVLSETFENFISSNKRQSPLEGSSAILLKELTRASQHAVLTLLSNSTNT